MPWPKKVKDEVLSNCGRHCCICHRFCGLKMELHHIILKSEGGSEDFDNCIPLCFDCHADMKSYDHSHPKGTKYSREELKIHRNNWYDKVKNNLGLGVNEEHIKQDRQTITRIIQLLPLDGSILLVKDTNHIYKGFETKKLSELNNFLLKLDNEPWIEFYDSDLEGLKDSLYHSLLEFSSFISKHTFPKSTSGYSEIPPEWEYEQPERLEKVIDQIELLSKRVKIGYDNLLRLCRKKLAINF